MFLYSPIVLRIYNACILGLANYIGLHYQLLDIFEHYFTIYVLYNVIFWVNEKIQERTTIQLFTHTSWVLLFHWLATLAIEQLWTKFCISRGIKITIISFIVSMVYVDYGFAIYDVFNNLYLHRNIVLYKLLYFSHIEIQYIIPIMEYVWYN